MTISYSQGFLQTSGKEIVEGNGEPILLRGFGLGGWLVPEGYMLINRGWIEGFESPSQIEGHVIDLIGDEKANEFWNEYRKNSTILQTETINLFFNKHSMSTFHS